MDSVYYLDTNICIFHMRKPFGTLGAKINSIPHDRIKIPAVVKGELLVGAEKSNRRDDTLAETLAFLMPFEIVPFDDSILLTYSKMRAALELRGQKIGYNDTIIAATVLAKNGILVTNNMREFRRIDGLQCEDWTMRKKKGSPFPRSLRISLAFAAEKHHCEDWDYPQSITAASA